MRRIQSLRIAATVMAGIGISANANEVSDSVSEGLLQYIYMEHCKDFPPLPPDRLRTVEAMTAVVDKDELKKATIRLMITLNLTNKPRLAKFCFEMVKMNRRRAGARTMSLP
jgi:hypothetical protein